MNRKFLLGIFLSLLLCAGANAQTQEQKLEDMIKKIDKKVKLDQDYLDMYSLSFEPSMFADKEFKIMFTSKGDTLDLSSSPGGQVTYRIGFIREGVALDSMVFLYIDKTTRDTASAAGGGLGRGGASREEKTERVYYFKDFYASKKKDHQKYITLYKFLEDYIEEKELQSLQEGKIRAAEPKSTLGIDPNDDIRTKEGMSSRNNDDFLNFQRVNNNHKYPIYADDGAKNSKRRGAAAAVNPINVDLNFASLTVAHEKLKLGPGLASFHFSVVDRNLNLLPWESGYLNGGLRFLISSNGDLNDMREQFLMDIKVMARIGMDMKSISGSLPFLMTDEPAKINVGNGVTVDIATTRPFNNAPFLNFYFSTGSNDVTAPKIKLGKEDSSYWYSSFTQWEGFFSFFWNTDAELDGRFRMDLGVGSYDMFKTTAFLDGLTTKSLHNKIQPLIAVTFNWVIKEKDNTYSEKMGAYLKFFDSRLSALVWFKLLEFQPDHMIRFETFLAPEPMFRSPNEWETPGGVMFSIRYRYGFPVLSSISK
jgi:hypothetical protein